MTQDVNSTTTSGGHDDAQQQSAGSQPSQQKSAGPIKATKAKKPEKNLYEPYDTPLVAWNLIRILAYIIFPFVMRVRVLGRKNLPSKGPLIIAANHLSWTDIPLIPAFLPYKVVAMAKEEAFHSRVGWLVRFMGGFPVRRGEGDRQAIRAASEQLKQGKVLMMFPEGTRSKTHTLAKGHAGLGMIALRSGVPVVPVAIWGSEHALKKFRPRVTIAYGPPIILKPAGTKITREDIDAATEQVMRSIAEMLPPQYRGMYGEEEICQGY
ncbi:MAG TPA: lysophospholipid acyltransferase family protein [Ktedonobacteraceae bacterium]|jgi:1-acyl-sn-glycerol-3-phosphate acyltransferase|nr:lysophospholipid acyltransferase family protein [Ktedonobacteraceae bacterium]